MAEAPSEDHHIPRVSIGMPVFNGERYLASALDSLLAQTFSDFELIVSDDASTDNTAKICCEYAERDNRVRYVRQPRNLGWVENFHFVLEKAQGEFFMWAAHDDKWDSQWIEELLNNFDDSFAISFGRVVYIDGSDRFLWGCLFRPFSRITLLRVIDYFLRQRSTGKSNFLYALVKRDFLRRFRMKPVPQRFVGVNMRLTDEILYSSADVRLIFEMLNYGEICQTPRVTMYRRFKKPPNYVRIRNRTLKEILLVLFGASTLLEYICYIGAARNAVTRLSVAILIPVAYLHYLFRQWFRFACKLSSLSLGRDDPLDEYRRL